MGPVLFYWNQEKMEEFYQELVKKEGALESSWQQRHKSLEDEHTHLQQIIAAKQAELDAWEKRRLSEEDSLKRRNTDLEIKSQQLAQEYRKKQQEIEDLKGNLQHSITELVRQYQTRLRTTEPTANNGLH
jgi:predicted  nucleic acid-binding Zn-ribbon protein